MNRNETREVMMQLIFQMEAQHEFNEEIKNKFLADKDDLKKQGGYAETIFKALLEHREEIDKTLEEASANWKLERMNKVDLAVLRLATAELLFISDIPTSVSINEAVNLAKKFGAHDSGKFINGILGKIARNLSDEETEAGLTLMPCRTKTEAKPTPDITETETE